MLFLSFKEAASKLAATILAPDAPPVAAVAPEWQAGDPGQAGAALPFGERESVDCAAK